MHAYSILKPSSLLSQRTLTRVACRQAVVWKALKELSRPALHAQTLGFTHPLSGEWLQFTSELPPDFAQTLTQLEQLK